MQARVQRLPRIRLRSIVPSPIETYDDFVGWNLPRVWIPVIRRTAAGLRAADRLEALRPGRGSTARRC